MQKASLSWKSFTSQFFFHVASSEDFNFHIYCPATKDTCCQYKRVQINGTNLYKPGQGFHDSVITHVKPEYAKLIDESELAKCLHNPQRYWRF